MEAFATIVIIISVALAYGLAVMGVAVRDCMQAETDRRLEEGRSNPSARRSSRAILGSYSRHPLTSLRRQH